MPTKKEKLETILKQLKTSGDVEGAAVLTRDGLLIASDLSNGVDADTLAAMTATMVGAAETAVQELKRSTPDNIIVESKTMKLISVGAGNRAILVCMVKPKAKLGLVMLDMKKAAMKVKKEVGV